MLETWETRFGIRANFLCALTLFYLATEGVEMLPAPLPADSKRALRPRNLILATSGPQISLAPPSSLAACTLWHLQVNVQLLI